MLTAQTLKSMVSFGNAPKQSVLSNQLQQYSKGSTLSEIHTGGLSLRNYMYFILYTGSFLDFFQEKKNSLSFVLYLKIQTPTQTVVTAFFHKMGVENRLFFWWFSLFVLTRSMRCLSHSICFGLSDKTTVAYIKYGYIQIVENEMFKLCLKWSYPLLEA